MKHAKFLTSFSYYNCVKF